MNSECSRECHGCFAEFTAAADFKYLLRCESGVTLSLASGLACPLIAVAHVVAMGPELEVVGIHTGPVVTSMPDELPIGYRSALRFPHSSVSADGAAVATEVAVAVRASWS
jgi:hypothetical protein